ncbi:hypothetical protein OVA21_11800 [Dietzia sp. SL131]|jgi:hypothetical protein|uniref:hypothetical protein n=1 Tax=Dietzia TaxID=37914 RepID=UPI000BDF77A0|nr:MULTISPECIES: hypothetical protein [unclassified Dietzia]MCY1657868.1 hypothetical protein [Dietzia sp. SL131]HBD22587.1 hypothetical protein [Dietzia sp.]
MGTVPTGLARTAEGRRTALAEQSVARFTRQLSEWDAQRAALVADDLGTNPRRRVPGTWPAVAVADATALGQQAAPLSANALAAECSTLWWSGIGKVIGGAVSAVVLLSLPISLVLAAVG